tara:strand:- start:194 stop:970 length:777 start_codon:yes stop_codon:yes gene_type:complete
MTSLDIYIGFNSSNYGQQMAYEVCKRSLLHHNPNLKIHKLVKKELEQKGLFNRNDNTGSTEFTYARFLVPRLNNYKGYALYCDSNFLWKCDPSEMIDKYIYQLQDIEECNKLNKGQYLKPSNFTVGCVKHKYAENCRKLKMDGQSEEWYPRNHWSSLMLFNCSKCENLSPEVVNSQTPKYLHRMEWCDDSQIISLDKSYNYLVDYYDDIKKENIKALHYTNGGPWIPGYENTSFAKEWLECITDNEKNTLIKEIGVKI